jgi:hypothetical protein
MSRAPGGLVAIAALRVAFDFAMLFQQAANQFRHFFVTFGLDDLPASAASWRWYAPASRHHAAVLDNAAVRS